MKYFIVAIVFSIWCTQEIYSFENSNADRQCLNFNITDDSRKYISYEFGLSNINTIYIAEGDTVCDVFMRNDKGQNLSTKCKKTPILKWAFDDMENELGKSQAETNNDYTPFYFQLSILKGHSRIIAASPYLQIKGNDELAAKLEELKTFMIKLWSKSFLNDTSQVDYWH